MGGAYKEMTNGVKSVRAVERALEILVCFFQKQEPLGVGEITRLTRIPKSTAYRLLTTMELKGFLQRVPETEKFQLNPALSEARLPVKPGELQAVAQSVMEGLRDTCGETVGLYVPDGDERVCIAAVEGIRMLRTSSRVGRRAPLYSGAAAKAILAFLPEERWDAIIARTGLAPLTPNTITDPARLKAELTQIRREGYAVSTGEWDEGITSMASPLFDRTGAVAGSINISVPSFRFNPDKISMLVGALRAAAGVINERLRKQPGAGTEDPSQ